MVCVFISAKMPLEIDWWCNANIMSDEGMLWPRLFSDDQDDSGILWWDAPDDCQPLSSWWLLLAWCQRHQAISNHHADLLVMIISHESYHAAYIFVLWIKQKQFSKSHRVGYPFFLYWPALRAGLLCCNFFGQPGSVSKFPPLLWVKLWVGWVGRGYTEISRYFPASWINWVTLVTKIKLLYSLRF